jgi:L-alanine-DL-glutamate epimerase-like enolase superfamily enzyme
MKITAITVAPLAIPLERPMRTAVHETAATYTAWTEVRTDAGLTGYGYCFAFGPRRLAVLRAMVEDLAEKLIGRDPELVQGAWQDLWNDINFVGHEGVSIMGLSALDMALWDLVGKAAGKPLYRVLGGLRDRLLCYASEGLWLSAREGDLVKEAMALAREGFRAVKMRLGKPTDAEDFNRVRAVRRGLGEQVLLLADVNQGWDVPTTLRRGAMLEELNLYWLEEPLPYYDLDGYGEVCAALVVPIAMGETNYSPRGIQAILDHAAADILMPDLQRMGGVTGWMRGATLAGARGIPVSPHLFTEASLHLAAASPNCSIVEHIPWWQPLFRDKLRMEDGHLALPASPGLGIDPDPDALERFRLG